MESVLIRKAKAEDVGDIIQLLKELQTGHIGLEISAAENASASGQRPFL